MLYVAAWLPSVTLFCSAYRVKTVPRERGEKMVNKENLYVKIYHYADV